MQLLVGTTLAVGALVMMAPPGQAAADPGGVTDQVDDYLRSVNALVEQFNGGFPTGQMTPDQFSQQLNLENDRFVDALTAATQAMNR